MKKFFILMLATFVLVSGCKLNSSGGVSSKNEGQSPRAERDVDDKSDSLPLIVYTFKNDDGNDLGTALLRGEQSFGEIKSKVADVYIVESMTGFLGWVVDGDTTLIKNENKYSSKTTFVAMYDLRLQSFNVQVDIMDYLWLHIDSNKYTYFDATGVFTIDASDPSAKSSIQKYKNAVEMMYSTPTSDPSYSFYYNEKIKYEKSLNPEGLCWLGQDAAGFSTFEVWTTDWQVLYLSLSGKELLDVNDKVVYKRID